MLLLVESPRISLSRKRTCIIHTRGKVSQTGKSKICLFVEWLIEWWFTTSYQLYHGYSPHNYLFPGFESTRLKYLTQGHLHKNPIGSSAARTWGLLITGHRFYH